jgi:hypothetical protein
VWHHPATWDAVAGFSVDVYEPLVRSTGLPAERNSNEFVRSQVSSNFKIILKIFCKSARARRCHCATRRLSVVPTIYLNKT